MRSIGVLGANGFVGARVVETLHLSRRAQAVPIVRAPSSMARSARFALEVRFADALDEAALTPAFAGCDVVVHTTLGALDQIAAEPPVVYRAAAAAGVRRIVYISTASVHGQDPEPGTDETSPLRDDQPFPYNNVKVRAERIYRRLRRDGKVELVMLRPGIVFGPRDVWITGIARDLACGQAVLVDGGRGYCNTTYVDNLVQAVELAMDADADDEAFLVGDEAPITWAEIYHWVAVALGDCPPPRSVDAPPLRVPRVPLLERARRARALKPLRRALPPAWRAAARNQLLLARAMAEGRAQARRALAATDWSLHDEEALAPVSIETAMLHRCRWKFPFAKAARLLGYKPRTSVETGLIRAIESLRFSDYAVNPAFADSLLAARRPAPARSPAEAAPATAPLLPPVGPLPQPT